MYRKRETKIADAIKTDSSKNRVFAYVVLFVIALVAVVLGYVLSQLVTALSKNMEQVTSNMNTMTSEMVLMRKEITLMRDHLQSIDSSVIHMSHDTQNMKDIKDDIHDITKLNPARLF